MRGRYDLSDDEDPYGPGSDLVLSLFAMAMLLVALIGSGDALVEQKASTEDTKAGKGTAGEVVLLLRENQGLRDENNVLKKHLSPEGGLVSSGDSTDLRRLQILLAESRKGEEEAKTSAATLAAKVAQAEDKNSKLVELFKQQQAIAKDGLNEVRLNRGLLLVRVTDEVGKPLFECVDPIAQGSNWSCLSHPTAQLMSTIRTALRARANDIEIAKVNSLSIEVNNSIEPVASPNQTSEGSLELSTSRAASIAEMLGSDGVPYVCMVSTGFGRSRAVAIRDQLAKDGNEALERFDIIAQSASDRASRIRSEDRIVTIRGFADDTSPCIWGSLASQLKQL